MKVSIYKVLCVGLFLFAAGCAGPKREAAEWRGPEGGYYRYDGVFYDWVDAEGRKGLKLWLPPTADPVRGVIIHGKPGSGGGGDTRGKARDRTLQEFAARFDFGIIGVTWFEGPEVYAEKTGLTILRVLEEFAGHGRHPELKNVPFIARGNSNSALFTYAFSALVPERVICFTPNVGPMYTHADISEPFLRVPGLLHVGPNDPFFTNGMADTEALFEEVAPKGALWAWTAEQDKAHADGRCTDVDFVFYETCIRLRLPADADPRRGPVKLHALSREDGWLVDLHSWTSGLTYVAAYEEYERERSRAGWAPTEDVAFLYRSLATYDNPLSLTIDRPSPANENAEGVYLDTKPGAAVRPGEQVRVSCEPGAFTDWTKIELYDGADLLGAVTKGTHPEWRVTVGTQKAALAFCAMAENAVGDRRTSYPRHLIVTDPRLEKALEAQRRKAAFEPAPEEPIQRTGSGMGDTAIEWMPDWERLLPAYGLSAEQEQGFARDGRLSSFWDDLDQGGQVLELSASRHSKAARKARAEKTAVELPAGDARIKVKAAHSRAGLYLLFTIRDNQWTEGDKLDFHLAWQNPEDIWTLRNPSVFAKAGQYSLLRRERQYHLPVTWPYDAEGVVSWNYTDPWDIVSRQTTLRDLEDRYRSTVDVIELSTDRRAVEWFMPWTFVGTKGPGREPDAGTRLALVLGYNDNDRTGKSAIRWPYGLDPWAVAAARVEDERPWGALLLLP